MISNCYVVLNHSAPDAAIVEARWRLAQDIHPSRDAAEAKLFRAPEVVKAGWGYPDRVVVTFDPSVRDWNRPEDAKE